MKRRHKQILAVLAILLFFSVGFKTAGDYFEISKNMDIFGKLYTEVNRVYVDETNPTDLMHKGIDSILKTLDPYTNFYSESQIENSKIYSTGQYSSIGAEVGIRGNKVLILELFEKGPADEAGLQVGDELVKIDDETISEVARTLDDVNNLLLGEQGSMVTLTVKRPGEGIEQEISIARGGTETQRENVPFSGMVNNDIGYILQTGFMQDAGREVAQALISFKKENPNLKGVILDLRGNPGGRVDEAVNVSNVFINQGERIVEMRGRTPESRQSFRTLRQPVDTDIPVAVLVNRRSASASEIVAGSIQDLDRGVIIGQRSFGKGLVQNVRPLSYNTQMKITIARYYTPSGRCIQAIDYFHRDAEGQAGKVADSLISEFKTRNGRIVYDGGGIDPDIPISAEDNPPVRQGLIEQGLIFDFVTRFSQTHDSIAGPRAFQLNDEIYEEFVAFVRERGFDFPTQTDKQLENMREVLKKESRASDLAQTLASFEKLLEEEKQKDLFRHKDAISIQLKREIINRYFFKQGVLMASFEDDPLILEAVEVLNDTERYKSLLTENSRKKK